VLQAVPGGVIPVTCLTLLYRMVPRRKLGTAMGMYGLGIVVAPGVGPTLGGYLVDYVSWRLIFYVNVPVGVLGAIAAMLVLPRFPRSSRDKFDVPGFLCIAAGLSALLLALTKAEDWGWGSYRTLMLICAGLLLLALFVVVELEVAQPLLDLRVFTSWPYVNSLVLIAVLSVGLFAVLFYVPLFLQEGQQVTAMNTGLTVLPQALVLMVMMPLAGRLYDRIGPRWPAVVGLAVCGIGSLLMADIEADVPRPDLVAWTMIRAAGLGLAMMPVMTGGIDALPPSAVNSGSAFNTLVQRVTAALGLAVLTALMTSEQVQSMADRSALVQAKGGQTDPSIQLMEHAGPSGVLSLARQLELQAQAQAYADVFYVVAWFTLAGAVLALFLRSGSASGDRAGAEAERE
jgi:EmrB/QacA subfamily drug resistance transporter